MFVVHSTAVVDSMSGHKGSAKTQYPAVDEYATGDPYGVTEASRFHQRRLQFTIEAMRGTAGLLLDVGCGLGHFTAKFARTHDAVGIDLSSHALSFAGTRYQEPEFVCADALTLPFRAPSFDVVVCNNIVEHVDSPGNLLRECHRVLKRGGFLIVSTPNWMRLQNRLLVVLGREPTRVHPSHVKEFTFSEMKGLITATGFEVLDGLSWPEYPAMTMRKGVRHLANAVMQSMLILAFNAVGSPRLNNTIIYKCKKMADSLPEQDDSLHRNERGRNRG